MSSPLGLLFVARSPRGLRYLEFMDRRSLKRTIAGYESTARDATWEPSLLELKPVVDQLEGYFSGTLKKFTLPLDPDGTEFQHAVWRALLDIPYAETRSYGEVARTIGQPQAARAVGLANNQNPTAIIVPCHRVIGAGGSLVGYGGGMHRKKWLLDHEARFARLDARAGAPVPPRAAVRVTTRPPARATPRAATRATEKPLAVARPARKPAALPRGPGKKHPR
jgi:methylated-DNA-[protein]-cysteine S-methyltransferase